MVKIVWFQIVQNVFCVKYTLVGKSVDCNVQSIVYTKQIIGFIQLYIWNMATIVSNKIASRHEFWGGVANSTILLSCILHDFSKVNLIFEVLSKMALLSVPFTCANY